eukprot:TRINITY_DN34436_c0_g1_i1.p1 TRINITY_DN34436_c0_g1~~TRINITY_DN34436_c0_g1_i1.p1  ORF type:complete len:712 (-),score=138.02 TRINITY_DN34436_c0_g1_i1:480-2615(-)
MQSRLALRLGGPALAASCSAAFTSTPSSSSSESSSSRSRRRPQAPPAYCATTSVLPPSSLAQGSQLQSDSRKERSLYGNFPGGAVAVQSSQALLDSGARLLSEQSIISRSSKGLQLSLSEIKRGVAKASKGGGALCEGMWRPMNQFDDEYTLEVGRELGCGGCGHVYLGMHKTGISRAVKVVRRDNAAADRALQQEYDIVRSLQDCPHVVRVIDAFVGETYRYLVLELCFGLDLVDSLLEELSTREQQGLLDKHPNLPHLAAVFKEMVQAVAQCHSNDICHMDIKPENFIHMSTESRNGGAANVKLLDFGLAWKDEGPVKITMGTQLGCSKYLAPELLVKGKEVDPKPCDMYALGVSLFNLYTGRFPYSFGRMGRPNSRPDLTPIADPAMKDLIGQLLCSDPKKRPTAEQVLQHDFLRQHANAQVEPLSEFTDRSVKSFFLEESPSLLQGRGCDCHAVAAQCCHRAFARTLTQGEVLFKEGEHSRAVYYITNGSFDVIKDGRKVGSLASESVVGEMGALFDRPRVATVVAATDAEVFEFKDFGEKLGSTQQRYALKGLQETALNRMRRDTLHAFLRESPLFREASEELLDTVLAASEQILVNAGDVVLDADDDKMALYFVQEGELEVRDRSSAYTLNIGPGEVFGDMAVVFGQRKGETIVAMKPTTALVFDRAEFALVLSEFPKEREVILANAEKRLKELRLNTGLLLART